MASKRRLSRSPSPEQITTDTPVTQVENTSKPGVCLICGDKAFNNNYGALSCQPCKTFFRRNGFRPETVRPCIFNKCCEVNIQTRSNCTACRLDKCFKMGMNSDLIRKEDLKKAKSSPSTKSDDAEQITSQQTTSQQATFQQTTSQQATSQQATTQQITSQHTTSQQIITTSQISILDLIRVDQSLLIDSEWTLLSNIVHAYDTFSNVLEMRQTVDSLSTLPVETHFNIINPLEIVSQMFTTIQLFISSSPDFRILTVNEQASLFERNLHSIIGFYSIFFFRTTRILHNVEYMEAFISTYGSEIMLLAKNVSERLDPDSTLIKLILIIFAFSSNGFILNQFSNIERDSLLTGTFRLLGSQNVYVELLWKYMVSRYGYNEAAIRFTRLTQIFLCVLQKMAIIYENNEAHQNMVDGVIEQTKKSLILNENKPTSLWGKT